MKTHGEKLNQVAGTIALIFEILYWGMAAMHILYLISFLYNPALVESFWDPTSGMLERLGYSVQGLSDVTGPFVIMMLRSSFSLGTLALVARNIHLIFQITAGKTRDSIGPTPFPAGQREAHSADRPSGADLSLWMFSHRLLRRFFYGADVVVPAISPEYLFLGILILCLSQFFRLWRRASNRCRRPAVKEWLTVKTRKEKLNKVASTVAWLLELLYWANTSVYVSWLISVWYFAPCYHEHLFAVTKGVLLSFGYPIQDVTTAIPIFVVAMVNGMLVSGLMALIFHNIRRIFDVSAGVDWDSIGPTPFPVGQREAAAAGGVLCHCYPPGEVLLPLAGSADPYRGTDPGI